MYNIRAYSHYSVSNKSHRSGANNHRRENMEKKEYLLQYKVNWIGLVLSLHNCSITFISKLNSSSNGRIIPYFNCAKLCWLFCKNPTNPNIAFSLNCC